MFYKLIEKKVENTPWRERKKNKNKTNKNAAAHGGVGVAHVQLGHAHIYFLYENLLLAHSEHVFCCRFGGKVNSPVPCRMF